MSHIINDEFYGESYMTVKYYKPFFEKVQTYIPYQITPNMITITNFILLIYLYKSKLYYNNYIFALFQFIFFSLDFVDGIHARKTNRQSKLGEILDHAIDPLRIILVIKMFFDIFKINDNGLLISAIIIYNLFVLIAKYTKKYLYGTKYISIDDTTILIMVGTLFLDKINHKIIKNSLHYIKYIIGFFILLNLRYAYGLNITKIDILIFLVVNYISYLNTNNLTSLLIINFLYPVYTIL